MEKGKKREVGLGRGLSDLLDDNDGIPNMKSQVLLRRESGERLKIYDKTGGEKKEKRLFRQGDQTLKNNT